LAGLVKNHSSHATGHRHGTQIKRCHCRQGDDEGDQDVRETHHYAAKLNAARHSMSIGVLKAPPWQRVAPIVD
jgi:hypothetical protein